MERGANLKMANTACRETGVNRRDLLNLLELESQSLGHEFSIISTANRELVNDS